MNLERWNKFTLYQKLGNIGSDVARARLCEEKKDGNGRNVCLERIQEMLDATINSGLPTSGKNELLKMKEVINCWFAGNQDIKYSPPQLEEYFTQFAYLI